MNNLELKVPAQLDLHYVILVGLVVLISVIVSAFTLFIVRRMDPYFELPPFLVTPIVLAFILPLSFLSIEHYASVEDIQNEYGVSVLQCKDHGGSYLDDAKGWTKRCHDGKVDAEYNAVVDVTFFKSGKPEKGVLIIDGNTHRMGLFYKVKNGKAEKGESTKYVPVDTGSSSQSSDSAISNDKSKL